MECHRIEEKLSAYIENQLSSEEKMQIDEHLKTCSKCSLSLEDLKKTIAYAQGLEEIEPPPWLTQKVMDRVREEAEQKKGILQKLFYPLHIKVPVQVIATIAIAVTTIYVFKTIQPEMRFAKAPSEEITSQTFSQEKDRSQRKIKDEIPALEESKTAPVKPAEQPIFAKEEIMKKYAEAEAPAPLARQDKVAPSVGTVANDKSKREIMSSAPESKAMAEIKKDSISLSVNVKDIESARKEIEKALMQLKGKIIRTEFFENKEALIAELDSEKLKELNEKLKLIGEVKEEAVVLESLKVDAARFRGKVKIRIEIVEIPF